MSEELKVAEALLIYSLNYIVHEWEMEYSLGVDVDNRWPQLFSYLLICPLFSV